MKAEIDRYVIQKVKERRELLGISQEALSFKMNKSASFIGVIERGKTCYNLKHLNEIAVILKCSPKDFMPEEPFK